LVISTIILENYELIIYFLDKKTIKIILSLRVMTLDELGYRIYE